MRISNLPSVGVDPIASDLQEYERLRVYPDCGVRTTRTLLMSLLICAILGMVFPVFYIATKKDLYFMLTSVCIGISNFLFIMVLWRILRYYLFLRRQRASGIPFDPTETLSFANYILKLTYLPLEDYSGNRMPVQNEAESM
ncbi:hypothetical protein TNCT_643371 [Trichonephila clavata]|uniref:Uncharacterized protein n=1 Tax=Trichonephila clavata TaxID=2740835 RepID=A0A8X6FH00_TRICU|nr:hypothetical protein TNCT_643371 [Trichonephila clavata]